MAADTKISSTTKAEIALKVIAGAEPGQLSKELDIPVNNINSWVAKLRNSATQVFEEDSELLSFSISNLQNRYVELLNSILQATPQGVVVFDYKGNILAYNKRFADMLNVPDKVMKTGSLDKILPILKENVADRTTFDGRIEAFLQNLDETNEETFRMKDGRILHQVTIPQVFDGKMIGSVTSVTDITEREQARQKLKESNQLLDSVTTNVHEAILRSTPDDGLIYVNEAFVKMFGYDSKEEVLKNPPQNYYSNPQRRLELLNKLIEGKEFKNEEVCFLRKDGSTFWGLESEKLIRDGDKIYIDAVINDITERKQAEEELRLSEEKYRTILDNIEDGYFETDLEGNFTLVNDSLTEILGYPEEELIGMNNRDYMNKHNAEKVFKAFNRVYRTGKPEKGYNWEIRTKHNEKRYVEASVTLVCDADNNPMGFRGIVRDITKRKKQEEQIRSSLKEKEALLSEIHHRVKNNLAVISGLLYLQSDKTQDPAARQLLEQSQSRINSMALIHEMLYDNQYFSSVDPGEYIRQLVDHISTNMQQQEKNIVVQIETGDIELDMNTAIPCALIINELMTNAFKYAFEKGKPGKILVRFLPEGDNYLLEISDNGVGLPEDFEFKKQSEESLGLFLVNTLVKQLGGTMVVASKNGTCFKITFPYPAS